MLQQVVAHHVQQLARLEGSLAEEKLRQREEMQAKLEMQRRRAKEVASQRRRQHAAPPASPRADLLARCRCSLSVTALPCVIRQCRFAALSDGLQRTLELEHMRQTHELQANRHCPLLQSPPPSHPPPLSSARRLTLRRERLRAQKQASASASASVSASAASAAAAAAAPAPHARGGHAL